MEALLHEQGHTPFRMLACSLGGPGDRALGLAEDGRQAMKDSVARNELTLIGGLEFDDSVAQRMQYYDRHAGERPIKAYVNVGGGTLSVGRRLGKSLYQLGLNTKPPPGCDQIDGIIPRFFARGLPVIHLVGFDRIAERNGIVTASGKPTAIGTGEIFHVTRYNLWLAAAVLVVILAGLKFFVLTDAGERVGQILAKGMRADPAEQVPAPQHRQKRQAVAKRDDALRM